MSVLLAGVIGFLIGSIGIIIVAVVLASKNVRKLASILAIVQDKTIPDATKVTKIIELL